MSGPTKTPWAVEVMPSGRITITSGQFFVAGDENGHGIEASDAALIVRAVNAYVVLGEYFNACESLQMTMGHPEASADDETAAENRYLVAKVAARDALAAKVGAT